MSREQTFVMDNPRKKKARKVTATTEQLLFSGDPKLGMGLSNIEEMETKDPLELLNLQPNAAVITGKLGDNPCKSLSYVVLPAVDKSKTSAYSELQNLPDMSSPMSYGEIIPFTGESGIQRGSYLVCAHVAQGHTQAVLCVDCTEDVLFSGSKDRTVKIWDLASGTEIQKLGGHPSGVVKVCYCEYTRLAFTASASVVKVWDVRQDPSSCVQTFLSSGQTRKGNHDTDLSSRYHSVLSEEYQINDIALNHYGTILFSASSGSVRMWDLRMFQSIGALNVGYQSNVLCLAVDDLEFDKNMIITGSKAHSIQVFEVMEDSRGIHHPKFTLVPPHYDGVQALAINGDFLFSGSRDMSIKKWDLRKRCVEHSQYQAHRDWVSSLNVLQSGNLFISGCRSGYIKLWSTHNCGALEEIRAHGASINSIISSNSYIFTASNDTTVGIWRLGTSDNMMTSEYEFQN